MNPLKLILPLLLLQVAFRAAAISGVDADSTSRPVTAVYSLETGGNAVADTYLSPLRYHGSRLAISGLWAKALPANPQRLFMEFNVSTAYHHLLNPSHTASMLGLTASFSWGMQYRFRLPYDFTVQAGGDVGLEAGVFYIPRNSNNPASAKFSMGIGPSARISRPLTLGKLHILLSDRVALPSLSLFFAPQYGEPYYEIWLGNHSGLAHCGWWGNHFGIDNMLSADLDFGRTALRIGYRFNVSSSYVNHINYTNVSHSFVVGVIPGGLGLKPRKPSHKSVIINALY